MIHYAYLRWIILNYHFILPFVVVSRFGRLDFSRIFNTIVFAIHLDVELIIKLILARYTIAQVARVEMRVATLHA